jgi:hypothetical protein
MSTRRSRAVAAIVFMAAALSCSSPTEPHSDIASARRVWLLSRPQAYTFEVAFASSWFPKSGYFRVEVADGRVQAASDSGGVAAELTLTVDTLWTWLLAAHERGELNSALFNRQGVPIEVDWGPWEVDGGVRYWVRNFARTR